MSKRTCVRCVMDTTASEITFDAKGVCNFCRSFDERFAPMLARARTPEGAARFQQMVKLIQRLGSGRPYDSLLGLSGGTDSCYLAYVAARAGLRPLVVHVDMGWNTQLSEANVKAVTQHLGLELEVVRVPAEPMRRLQLAFYRAGLRNCEIPQDHVYLAALYDVALRHGLQVYLGGGNATGESVLPRSWGYNTSDVRHIRDVHRQFGQGTLRGLPMLPFWKRYVYARYVRPVRDVRLLDLVPYSPATAKRELAANCGWQDYGAKHYESVLTRFYQGAYLPRKFGIDKRRAHFSSLILSEQMTRAEALQRLSTPPYESEELLKNDQLEIATRLGLDAEEWAAILSGPTREHSQFANAAKLFAVKDFLANGRRRLRRR